MQNTMTPEQTTVHKLGELLPVSICPFCGYKMDAATSARDDAAIPKPGDLSMCLKCTSILQFDETLHLIELTTAEFARLPESLRAYLHRIRQVARNIDRSWLDDGAPKSPTEFPRRDKEIATNGKIADDSSRARVGGRRR